jgi:hypothetical protein
VTDLQRLYAELREQGFNHHGALKQMAARLGVDPPTARRNLQSAERRYGKSWSH